MHLGKASESPGHPWQETVCNDRRPLCTHIYAQIDCAMGCSIVPQGLIILLCGCLVGNNVIRVHSFESILIVYLLPRQPIVIPLATAHSQNTFQVRNLIILLCMDAGRQQNN